MGQKQQKQRLSPGRRDRLRPSIIGVGLISIINIADNVISKNRSLDRTDVYEVMIKPVLTLDRDMDVRYAIKLLTRFRLNRAVVVDHQRDLVGIVTLRDMVLSYVHHDEDGVQA